MLFKMIYTSLIYSNKKQGVILTLLITVFKCLTSLFKKFTSELEFIIDFNNLRIYIVKTIR